MTRLDDRTRRAFLASLKHQLRTPLNAIIGYSEVVLTGLDTADPAHIRPDVEAIHTTGRRLLRIVNNIFDPSQIDGRDKLDFSAYRNLVHHQLRNPINIVLGYAEIAAEKTAAADHAEPLADLERIDQAGQQLLHQIDDIIDVAQMEDAEQEMAIENMSAEMLSLSSIAEDVVSTLRQLEAQSADAAATGRLLIVDDNPDSIDILGRQLKVHGHIIVGVSNGRAALNYIREHEIDLMLLDLFLPDINGYDLLRQVKADETLHNLPIIVLSALDDRASMQRAISMGARDYLTKPFNPTLLQARIAALLEQKHLRDREIEYLHSVAQLTEAAAAVEAGNFDPATVTHLTQRTDPLGRLARVFQNMAYEVDAREQRLKKQLQMMRIQIDRQSEEKQVAEIVDTDYFQQLQSKVKALRAQFNHE